MKMYRENRDHRGGGIGFETRKLGSLASVVRSEDRGKKVQAVRLRPVASAPRGDDHEQDKTTTAASLAAIGARKIPSWEHATADAS